MSFFPHKGTQRGSMTTLTCMSVLTDASYKTEENLQKEDSQQHLYEKLQRRAWTSTENPRIIALTVKMDTVINSWQAWFHHQQVIDSYVKMWGNHNNRADSLSSASRWENSGMLQQNISLYSNSVTATFAPVMVCR